MFELAVYAIIAVVIISKLYNVLGKGSNIPHIIPEQVIEEDRVDLEAEKYPQFHSVLSDITKKENSFLLSDFVSGAEKAFSMIINAVDNNNQEILKLLLSEKIYNDFNNEIKRRIEKCERYHTTIVAICSQVIEDISLVKNNITIKVKFTSEQIKIIKDQSGNIIRGDPGVTELVEETWSFQRNIKSSDVTWILISVS